MKLQHLELAGQVDIQAAATEGGLPKLHIVAYSGRPMRPSGGWRQRDRRPVGCATTRRWLGADSGAS